MRNVRLVALTQAEIGLLYSMAIEQIKQDPEYTYEVVPTGEKATIGELAQSLGLAVTGAGIDSPDDHRARHIALHKMFDELLADWIACSPHTRGGFINQPISNLMEWSHRQTIEPEVCRL